jgi:hypothetical protein
MLKYLMASAMITALAVPAFAGGAAPIGQLYPTIAPHGGVGSVLPGIVQSYTPSQSPLNVQPPSNLDDGESYGQALQEPQPGAPNGWTCSSGLC